ncbi:hypothetical protein EEB19_05100 [Gordonia sp. OPL2]|nr:hypothetical protein EEB19_05100 [Gordonia sp. OPL2]
MSSCDERGCERQPNRARGYCGKHYERHRRAGTLTNAPRRDNSFITECVDLYRALRADQDARRDHACIGYATEEANYFREVESRITYRSVLQRVSAERRARYVAEEGG